MAGKDKTMSELISVFAEDAKLTRRESEVVHCIAQGVVRSPDIAKALGVATNTVSNHLKRIFDKTPCDSKAELLSRLLKLALSDTSSP